ncbi:MAG: alpha-D-glucose phosphate-specific phosphoglucomutase, partial [Acidithiobacillus sp.]|nr:alpha-D-glucose phosphate-specific phosphoglucomutase [Acidithiobacillus sp.]
DHSIAEKQGIQIALEDRSRIVIRLSGTGTEGATLRFYFERFLRSPAQLDGDVQQAVSALVQFAYRLTGILERSGRKAPDVIT